MKVTVASVGACAMLAYAMTTAEAGIMLGPFEFDGARFGDSLIESDGGALSAASWLNVANADPGNPGYLTGPNFNTGIANLGLAGNQSVYTIGYNNAILNVPGDDLGIVVANFSSDDLRVSVSTDGLVFGPELFISAATAVDTGVVMNYFFAGSLNPVTSPAALFVHPLDLDDFGVGGGASIKAIKIRDGGNSELDLIRAAAFESAIPEPTSLLLVISSVGAMFGYATGRRRRSAERAAK